MSIDPAISTRSEKRFHPHFPVVLTRLTIPLLSFFTALLLGAIITIVSDPKLAPLWKDFSSSPGLVLGESWRLVFETYKSLLLGSLGNPAELWKALVSRDPSEIVRAFEPVSETLVAAVPLIFTGLSVALGFHAGLLNLGAEGQLYVGSLVGTFVAFAFHDLPPVIHVSLALVGGFLGGALWGFIPGILKITTGAHEVIVTMMLNFIAYDLVNFVLKLPFYQRPGRNDPISKMIEESAVLGKIIPGLRLHCGFVLALVVCVIFSWWLYKTTQGYEIRTMGSNPRAARSAGINIRSTFVKTMVLCGGLAGLAGVIEIIALNKTLRFGFSPGYGWDALAIAVLGSLQPLGIIVASILFGGLRAGSISMQVATGIPVELIGIIQALIILFVASPLLIREVYRIKKLSTEGTKIKTQGWGSP